MQIWKSPSQFPESAFKEIKKKKQQQCSFIALEIRVLHFSLLSYTFAQFHQLSPSSTKGRFLLSTGWATWNLPVLISKWRDQRIWRMPLQSSLLVKLPIDIWLAILGNKLLDYVCIHYYMYFKYLCAVLSNTKCFPRQLTAVKTTQYQKQLQRKKTIKC